MRDEGAPPNLQSVARAIRALELIAEAGALGVISPCSRRSCSRASRCSSSPRTSTARPSRRSSSTRSVRGTFTVRPSRLPASATGAYNDLDDLPNNRKCKHQKYTARDLSIGGSLTSTNVGEYHKWA